MEDSNGTILIVDDDDSTLNLLAVVLESGEYTILMANSGAKALEIVQTSPPEIILLDIMMPKMDGFEVCRHLKSDPSTQEIPVLFLTARDNVKDKVKGLELGAVDYITKPFFVEEVLARVATHLELYRMRQKDKLHIQQLSHEIYNRLYVEGQYIEQEQQNEAVLEMFHTTLDHLTEQLQDNNALIDYLNTTRAKLDELLNEKLDS